MQVRIRKQMTLRELNEARGCLHALTEAVHSEREKLPELFEDARGHVKELITLARRIAAECTDDEAATELRSMADKFEFVLGIAARFDAGPPDFTADQWRAVRERLVSCTQQADRLEHLARNTVWTSQGVREARGTAAQKMVKRFVVKPAEKETVTVYVRKQQPEFRTIRGKKVPIREGKRTVGWTYQDTKSLEGYREQHRVVSERLREAKTKKMTDLARRLESRKSEVEGQIERLRAKPGSPFRF